jgi:hypothetical protein
MKLLTICPSRNRPELLKRMLDSFDKTKSEWSDILVYVSVDDPQIGKYEDILNGRLHVFGPRRPLVEVLNYVSCEYMPGIPFYQEVNDDHVYITDKWDEKLISPIEYGGNAFGIAWGRDGMNNGDNPNLPTAAIVSGPVVRALGYFFPPTFKHIACDDALLDIGNKARIIFYNPDVTIEHVHYYAVVNNKRKAPLDDNYRSIYNEATLKEGREILHKWRSFNMEQDLERLNNAIKNWRANKVL